MKANLSALEKFAGSVQQDPQAAIKIKTVSGECNFQPGEPHFSASLEFPSGKTTLHSDNPPFMGGGGVAPDPILYCLFGTASCFAGTMMTIVQQRGMKVDTLKVTAQNKVNLSKPLGISDAPIVEKVWITLEYTGEATQADMQQVVNETVETCPGAYCIRNPIPLTADIRKV